MLKFSFFLSSCPLSVFYFWSPSFCFPVQFWLCALDMLPQMTDRRLAPPVPAHPRSLWHTRTHTNRQWLFSLPGLRNQRSFWIYQPVFSRSGGGVWGAAEVSWKLSSQTHAVRCGSPACLGAPWLALPTRSSADGMWQPSLTALCFRFTCAGVHESSGRCSAVRLHSCLFLRLSLICSLMLHTKMTRKILKRILENNKKNLCLAVRPRSAPFLMMGGKV